MLDPGPHIFGTEPERSDLAIRWVIACVLAAALLIGGFYTYRDAVRVQRHAEESACLAEYLPAADAMESRDEHLWRRFNENMHAVEPVPCQLQDMDRLRYSVQTFQDNLARIEPPVSLRTFIVFQQGRCEALLRMLDDLCEAVDPFTSQIDPAHPSMLEWRTRYQLLERMNLREHKGIETVLRRRQETEGANKSAELDRWVEAVGKFHPSLMPLQEQPDTLLKPVTEPLEP